MNRQVKKMLKKAEALDWIVSQEDGNLYNFRKYSPAGQDFSVNVDTENNAELFLNNLLSECENFDVSEETYFWLDNMGHGKNGAPYDMKDVHDDMEACLEMMQELYESLYNIL